MKLNISKTQADAFLAKTRAPKSVEFKVLLIDDEPANLYSLEAILESEFKVFATTSPVEALRVVAEENVDVILSDQRMPDKLGTDLLREMMAINDDNIRMILTGYTDAKDLITCINEGLIYRYLVKPWAGDEIRAAVRQGIERLSHERTIRQLIPKQVVSRLYDGMIRKAAPGDGQELSCAILFLDIRQFTKMAASMQPREAFRFLTSYMSAVGPLVTSSHGFIDKYLGDGVLAVFDRPHHYRSDALECAVKILDVTENYNRKNRSSPVPESRKGGGARKPIDVGIGINEGGTMLGAIGFEGRLEFTVLGDAVNSASRIQDLTKALGTPLLVQSSVLAERPDLPGRELGLVSVRGRPEPLQISEVCIVDTDACRAQKLADAADLFRGIQCIAEGQPDKARPILQKIVGNNPDDSVARYFLEEVGEG